MAQTHEGLPITINFEFQESETKTSQTGRTKEINKDINTTGSAGIPLLGKIQTKLGMSHKKNNSYMKTLTQLDAGKEIISKQLHDEALYDFEQYLEENKNLTKIYTGEKELEIGSYVKIHAHFQIINLNFLINMLSEDINEGKGKAFSDILFSIPKLFSNAPEKNNQGEGNESVGINSRLDKLKKEAEQDMKALLHISKILPSSAFIRLNHYIAPMKAEYLRESPEELSFKYGSNESQIKITLLGKVTRKVIKPEINEGPLQLFEEGFLKGTTHIASTFDHLLEMIKFVEEGDYIVSPIAIYFE